MKLSMYEKTLLAVTIIVTAMFLTAFIFIARELFYTPYWKCIKSKNIESVWIDKTVNPNIVKNQPTAICIAYSKDKSLYGEWKNVK